MEFVSESDSVSVNEPLRIREFLVFSFRKNLFFKQFQVTNILERFPVWKEYKDQKHDLFISDRPVSGYLTGKHVPTFAFVYFYKFYLKF